MGCLIGIKILININALCSGKYVRDVKDSQILEKGRSSSAVNSGYAKKCKELERLEAQVSEAYAAFDAMGDNTSRTRSQKLKRPKSLSKLINELGKNFNNKVEEVEGLKEDIRLERRKFADTLEQTKLSYEPSHEEALRREEEA